MSVSVSESIGKLLLEGYKMLADSCEVCYTVLMQDRRGRVICVKCESSAMANAALPDVRTAGKMMNGNATNHDEENTLTAITATGTTNRLSNPANRGDTDNSNKTALESCEEILVKEMQNAAITLHNLAQVDDMQGKLSYVRYIRECAETIQALKGIQRTK